MKFCLLLLSAIALIAEATAAPMLDIKAIAGKTSKEVEALLGAPEETLKTKYGPKLTYKGETVEVVYIKGKADWITFTPETQVPFSKEFLGVLGLPLTAPTFANPNSIRWEELKGFVSISICPGADTSKVDFAYIKVATK